MNTYSPVGTGAPSPLNLAATYLVWLVALVVGVVGLLAAGAGAMATDACAYQECGDESYVALGLGVAACGGGAVALATLITIIWRHVARRRALAIAVLGLVVQLVVAVGAVAIVAAAGPV